MAGDESLNWHPVLSDFILLGRKLTKLGFTYSQGQVIILRDYERAYVPKYLRQGAN